MASQVHLPLLLLAVWLITGVISIFGGMINAEVGSVFPQTGGMYVYFRHMYGDFFAFLFGWAGLIVINTASIAGIAFLFAQYSDYFLHLPRFDATTEHSFAITIPFIGKLFWLENIGVKLSAIALIFLLTIINIRSVKAGAYVQVLFTIIKLLAITFLIAGIFLSGKGNVANFYTTKTAVHFSGWEIVTGMIAACSGALAAYDGWIVLGYAAGEVKNPARNIPKGLLIGISICIIAYIFTNQAYLYMLPIEDMKLSQHVAADAYEKAAGLMGGGFIAVLVMISTIGGVNGNVLPCARLNYAMATDGRLFKSAAKVHPRYKTPVNSLWLQCIISCLFVLSGSFDMLMDMFVFIAWIFYGFLGYGVIVLRHKMPEAERSYKVWGYPYVPIVFVAFSAFYFVVTIYNEVSNYNAGRAPVINSLLGLALTATGVPFYFYFKRKYRNLI